MRKQKRWTTEEEILAAIDYEKTAELRSLARYEWATKEKELCFKAAAASGLDGYKVSHFKNEAYQFKEKANKSMRGANNHAGRAIELGHKLAAFRTAIMPAITNDMAVV